MNCFNHPGVPAVGICKACQKGLCMECVVDLGHGIACKNHREEVEILNSTGGVFTQAPLFLFPLGLVMSLGGAFLDTNGPILTFMGIGMLVFGTLFSILGSKLRKPINK